MEGNGHVHWKITGRNSGAIFLTDVGLNTPQFMDMVQDVNDVYGFHGGEVVGMGGDLGYFSAGQRLLFFLHTGADEDHREWFYFRRRQLHRDQAGDGPLEIGLGGRRQW